MNRSGKLAKVYSVVSHIDKRQTKENKDKTTETHMRKSGSFASPVIESKLSVIQSSNNISLHKNEAFAISISGANEKPPKLPK